MTVRLTVRLNPRAGRTSIDRIVNNVVYVSVMAPPVDGAANRALCEMLARFLRIPTSAVTIRSGATSRMKIVEIVGTTTEEVFALIARSVTDD